MMMCPAKLAFISSGLGSSTDDLPWEAGDPLEPPFNRVQTIPFAESASINRALSQPTLTHMSRMRQITACDPRANLAAGGVVPLSCGAKNLNLILIKRVRHAKESEIDGDEDFGRWPGKRSVQLPTVSQFSSLSVHVRLILKN